MKKFLKSFLSIFNKIINRGLHFIETKVLDKDDTLSQNIPVFIVGAPRSGSTLLYQVMTDYYDVGYFTNLHCWLFGGPSLVQSVVHFMRLRKISSYRSAFGKTKGLSSPSECGEYWYRFFRFRPSYVSFQDVDPIKMNELRKSMVSLGKSFGKPLLFKNMHCTLRLKPLSKVFPEALFIVIKRDLLDNAHSLLETRYSVNGNYTKWWSMEPPNIDELRDRPPYEQVVEQIRQIYGLIQQDRTLIGEDKFFEMDYEDFCDDVHGTLQKLNVFFETHGVNVKNKVVVPPGRFERRTEIRIDKLLYEQVKEYASHQ